MYVGSDVTTFRTVYSTHSTTQPLLHYPHTRHATLATLYIGLASATAHKSVKKSTPISHVDTF